MAHDLYTELHDALSSPAQESQWAAWSEIRQAQREATERPAPGSANPAANTATGRALRHAEASLADATRHANQAALNAALDESILQQTASAWQAARQRAGSCAQRVSRARRAYEIQCAAPGPASTAALVALTAFRQACSDAHAASSAAARALDSFNKASQSAAASSVVARRAAAAETAAMAAHNHALSADLAARADEGAAQWHNRTPRRPLQPCPRVLDHPGLVLDVARSQGFCRSLASRFRSSA